MALGKFLVISGLCLSGAGLAVIFLQRISWTYSWFGTLPGDLRFEGEHFKVYAPISSMVVLSVLITVVWRVLAFVTSYGKG